MAAGRRPWCRQAPRPTPARASSSAGGAATSDGPGNLMTLRVPRIALAGPDRDEEPVVAGAERQLQHTPGVGDLPFAIGGGSAHLIQLRAAGTGDELANASRRVWKTGWVLRTESFVEVIVPIDDDVDVVLVENVPQRTRLRHQRIGPRREEGEVKHGDRALHRMRRQIVLQPCTLRRIGGGVDRAVEHHRVPVAEVEAVVAAGRSRTADRRRGTEVAEISRHRLIAVVLVIAGCRTCSIEELTP